MVNTSKILTVSYGTFSCTLEGFDDSFDTMKAIAEYFRDLAADDRYFGAEPPTPDAEMLARIAEREISRRVEAREEQGKIHLRANENNGAAEALTHAVPAAEDAHAIAPAEEQADGTDNAAVPLARDTSDLDENIPQAPAEDVAEAYDEASKPAKDVAPDYTQRILEETDEIAPSEAGVAHAESKQPEPAENMSDSDPEEPLAGIEITDQSLSDVSNVETAADRPSDEAQDNKESVPQTKIDDTVATATTVEEASEAEDEYSYDADVEAFIADAADDEFTTSAVGRSDGEQHVVDDSVDQSADATELNSDALSSQADAIETAFELDADPAQAARSSDDEADSVAEKLRRIRSVVSQSQLDYEVSEYSEDEHAYGTMSNASDELDELLKEARDEEFEDADEAAPTDVETWAENADEELLDTELDAEGGARDADDLNDRYTEELDGESSGESIAFQTSVEDLEAHDLDAEPDQSEEAPQSAKETSVDVDEDTLSQLLADAAPPQTERVDHAEIGEGLDDLTADDTDDGNAPDSLFADLDDVVDETDRALNAVDEAPFILGKEARIGEQDKDTAARPLNARVLKMKKSDFESAIAHGMIEEDTGSELHPENATDVDDEAILSPEEEADLQRELSEVEAEMSEQGSSTGGDAEDAAFDDGEDDVLTVEASAPSLREDGDLDKENDDALPAAEDRGAIGGSDETASPQEAQPQELVDKPRRGLSRLLGMGKRAPEDEARIFEEADSQMGDKDASMRRTAIQHLRAAVAATKAEKSAGVDVDLGVDETPYRSDLAEVVRPRRPNPPSASGRSVRPNEQRPAPLKLVAEQRVDTERAPVRPRRVSSVPAAMVKGNDGGFSTFAEEMGATELSDLLEAAAAYMSDVEGHSEFTRPMLMGKLKEVNSGNYSREDGLRSFGRLLREGKLRKVQGGRFSATDETEFRAEARNAG
ncbi:hypothetical protein FIU86_00135 [Roseovarius sp. THAF9]|uniref:hypothetical protein n=1 Tax=Roseovarius sp. THAF9 TaxID=2587847 RepID=UPI0012680674|nr:hypothetical protein [Roseovarius sp. THAF9]QFT91233.1 hypothetical protein FIU86_00135 [Roseovarius sp. THAF9]